MIQRLLPLLTMTYFMKVYDEDHKNWKEVTVHSVMNENNMVLENKSLFQAIDQAISELTERQMQSGQRDLLMVVLSQDAMPVACQMARSLELNLTFSIVEQRVKHPCAVDPIEFDFNMVKESSRDLPQDFIFHQERNLKTTLKSIYDGIHKEMSSKYPNEAIILVDELINDGSEFRPAFMQDIAVRPEGDRISNTDPNCGGTLQVGRRFVYLHSSDDHMEGVHLIVEHRDGEWEQLGLT
jgi:hypothetical protein